MRQLSLDLYDIQGDALEGLPKNYKSFTFYKICKLSFFKQHLRQQVIRRITNALQVHYLELAVQSVRTRSYLEGLNLGCTKDGLAQLVGIRPRLDPAFERGANHQGTIEALHDPPKSRWLAKFVAERIDGVFLITGPNSIICDLSLQRADQIIGQLHQSGLLGNREHATWDGAGSRTLRLSR